MTLRGVRIRPARPDDKRAVRRLCRRIWDDDYIPAVFDEWVRDRHGRLWIAVADDRVVAVAKLTLMPSDEAWLHALRVDPAHRRLGIAAALLQHRLERARRLGARVARLDTSEDNIAIHRLMRRHAFRRVEVIAHYHASVRRTEPPRVATAADVAPAWRLARGRLFHEDYIARALTRDDLARAVRSRSLFAVGDVGRPRAVAIASPQGADGWTRRSRLRIRLAAGRPAAVRDLLEALRGEARAGGVARVGIAPPKQQWPIAAAAGYRRRWHEAMYVYEKRLAR